jgi:D-amino-acid oxidase
MPGEQLFASAADRAGSGPRTSPGARAAGGSRAAGGGDADVIVVGGGVAGLTTAVVLAESGVRVRVWTKEPARRTTSAVAGALWEPYRIGPPHRVDGWARHSFEVFARLAERPQETGVRMAEGLQAARGAGAGSAVGTGAGSVGGAGSGSAGGELPVPHWAADVPGLRRATAGELPDGYGAGFRMRLPVIDMPAYLDHLGRRLAAAGGEVVEREAASLAEAAGEAPAVVNCTGIGAHALVPDPAVRPVRGQTVVVENPGVTEWFVDVDEESTEALYFFPQPYGLVLGGTAQEDAWERVADPATAEAIISRCARVDPRIAGAAVIEHRVGLRPVREEVRLERAGECVHNYGHGGAGVTVSWGCAREAAALVTG